MFKQWFEKGDMPSSFLDISWLRLANLNTHVVGHYSSKVV